jgi:putative SOS response-associated peptidase YedK
MCGRFVLHGPVGRIEERFGLSWQGPFADRFNIAPTAPIAIVREQVHSGHLEREFALVRWGLLPSWQRDGVTKSSLHNARSETVAEKPSFKNAFQRRRCLIPASGYYEWQAMKVGGKVAKLAHYISRVDAQPLAMAGIWEFWQGADGSELESASVLTRPALGGLAQVHDRMPVWLEPHEWDEWLNPRSGAGLANTWLGQQLEGANILDSVAQLQAVPVSSEVNSGYAQGAHLIVPLIS